MAMSSDDRLWTTNDLARYLQLTPESIRMRRKRGQLPEDALVQKGRLIRWIPSRIRAWAESPSPESRESA